VRYLQWWLLIDFILDETMLLLLRKHPSSSPEQGDNNMTKTYNKQSTSIVKLILTMRHWQWKSLFDFVFGTR